MTWKVIERNAPYSLVSFGELSTTYGVDYNTPSIGKLLYTSDSLDKAMIEYKRLTEGL